MLKKEIKRASLYDVKDRIRKKATNNYKHDEPSIQIGLKVVELKLLAALEDDRKRWKQKIVEEAL